MPTIYEEGKPNKRAVRRKIFLWKKRIRLSAIKTSYMTIFRKKKYVTPIRKQTNANMEKKK